MKTTPSSPLRAKCVFGPLAGLATLLAALPASAQSNGNWNVDAAANWSTTGSWAGGTVASGAGMTATFANDVTADRTVTLDAPRTIGTLQFGDVATATAASWTIGAASTIQTLTLDNGGNIPVINVGTLGTGKLSIINTPVAGISGFRKDGPGTLRFGAANPSLSGPIEIARSRFILNHNNALGAVTSITANYDTAGGTGGTGPALELASNITAGAGATLVLTGTFTPDYRTSLIGNATSVWTGDVVLAGNNRPGIYAQNATPFTFSGKVEVEDGANPGLLFMRGAGLGVLNGTIDIGPTPFLKTDGGTWRIDSAGHQWGSTVTADGVVQMGIANAVPATAPLVLGQASGTVGRFDLNGFNQTVGGLRTDTASTASAAQTIRNFSATAATLTDIEADGSLNIYKGTILPNVHLKKSGTGTLQLEGSFDHLDTTVTEGPLKLHTAGNLWHAPPVIVETAGSLEKTGTGSARIGSITAAGPVKATEGTLSLGGGTTTGSLTVSGFGAALGFGVNGGRLTASTLSAGEFSGDTGALRFEMDSGTTPYVTVTQSGGFTVPGSATVNITAANLVPGTYTLIDYTGTIGGSGFAGLSLGQTPHLDAELLHDTANTRVTLKVNSLDSLIWTGTTPSPTVGGPTWQVDDATLDNFKKASDGSSTPFFPGDKVLFDDSALNTSVIAGTGILPGDLTFNNSTAATYSVSGVIAGAATITKTNNGPLELSGANAFTGKVTVSGGILKTSNASALGAITAATEILGGTDALPGGSLDLNGANLGKEPVLISGVGAASAGAVINNGSGQNNALRRLTLTDDATVGGSGRWDVRSQNEGGDFVDLAGHKLSKRGGNQISFVGVNVTPGDLEANEGILSLESTTTVQGAGTITVNPGGTLGAWSMGDGNVTRPIVLNGGLFNELGSGLTSIIDSPVSVAVPSQIGSGTAASTLRLDGVLSGSAALEKINAGVVTLNNTNTHSGPVTITAGILRIGTGGETGTPGTGTLTNNATLDIRRSDSALEISNEITGSGALTVNGAIGSLVTLTGNNSFSGAVTVPSGGLRITSSAALGSGIKTVTINNGTAGKPQLRLDGSDADIVLDAGLSYQTSNNDAAIPVILNEAGNNTINGAITMTTGGGGTYIRSDAGILTLAGDIAPNTGGRVLHLAGNSHGILSGKLNNTGTNAPALEKLGAGTWEISSTGSTYSGATSVLGGRLVVSGSISGANLTVSEGATLAGAGTVAPGGFSTAAINGRIAPGNITTTGDSLPGTLTLGNTGNTTAVNLSATSGFNYNLGFAGSAGFDYDHLTVKGTFALGAGLLDLSDFSFITEAGFGAGIYTLVQATSLTGTLGPATTGTVGGREAELSISGNTLILTVGDLAAGGYGAWAAGKGLTGPNSGPGDDFDKDGVSNLLEYAADSHPGQASSVPPTAISTPYGLSFARIPAHVDLTYEVEVSDNLSTWQTIASGSGGNPITVTVPGAATVTETGASPVNVSIVLQQNPGRRYARLKVKLP